MTTYYKYCCIDKKPVYSYELDGGYQEKSYDHRKLRSYQVIQLNDKSKLKNIGFEVYISDDAIKKWGKDIIGDIQKERFQYWLIVCKMPYKDVYKKTHKDYLKEKYKNERDEVSRKLQSLEANIKADLKKRRKLKKQHKELDAKLRKK